MTTLSRGATRADGRRFWAYEKRNGAFREKWYNPDAFKRAMDRMPEASRRWRRKYAAVHYGTARSACGHTAHHLAVNWDLVTCCHCKKWLTIQQEGSKVT